METHPNPQPTLHRKIDLQSPADLSHLQTLLARSARAKLDKHLPPHVPPATHIPLDGTNEPSDLPAEAEDELRRAVRELIDEFLLATWGAAAANIAVNGIDAAPPRRIPDCSRPEGEQGESGEEREEREGVDFVYAAFDPRLQGRVAALHGEVEGLTARVSALRREAPGSAAGEFCRVLSGELERDEERWKAVREGKVDAREIVLGAPGLGWDDTREMFERGVGELAVLSGSGDGSGLTETVGRGQRAGRVAMELE